MPGGTLPANRRGVWTEHPLTQYVQMSTVCQHITLHSLITFSRLHALVRLKIVCHPRVTSRSVRHLTLTSSTSSLSTISPIIHSFFSCTSRPVDARSVLTLRWRRRGGTSEFPSPTPWRHLVFNCVPSRAGAGGDGSLTPRWLATGIWECMTIRWRSRVDIHIPPLNLRPKQQSNLGTRRFLSRGASAPLQGVESCSLPNTWPNRTRDTPPCLVTPHLHGVPTAGETFVSQQWHGFLKKTRQ